MKVPRCNETIGPRNVGVRMKEMWESVVHVCGFGLVSFVVWSDRISMFTGGGDLTKIQTLSDQDRSKPSYSSITIRSVAGPSVHVCDVARAPVWR